MSDIPVLISNMTYQRSHKQYPRRHAFLIQFCHIRFQLFFNYGPNTDLNPTFLFCPDLRLAGNNAGLYTLRLGSYPNFTLIILLIRVSVLQETLNGMLDILMTFQHGSNGILNQMI